MKTHYTFAIILLIISLGFISCNSLRLIDGGVTYRYIYKGTVLFKYVSDTEAGDSAGVVGKTYLSELREYLEENWPFKKYWKIEYQGKNYYIDMKKTGWVNYGLEDSLSKYGKMIVKTIILVGDNAGQEKVTMKISVLDSNINKSGVDYAPTISPDGKTMYYVSQRPGSKLTPAGEPSHDFWAATKENKYDSVFSKPYNIDTSTNGGIKSINTCMNEGVATIAADGRTLYFTACDRDDGVGSCDIYTAKIFEGKWSRPMALDRNVNSTYWDAQPSLSPDMKVLYFVSNRPGPNGDDNHDIWYSTWNEEWEEWDPALNLSSINTKGNEAGPFIAADGVTLFFSSDGYDSTCGGMDFYVTKFDPESKSWSKPAHLPAPLNTEEDEEFITLPASGDIIYFSSERKDIPGYQGDLDLYMARIETIFRAIVLKIFVADDSQSNTFTYVTVDNPVSKRKVKEKTSARDNVLSMVLTNADYGSISDSIQYIDLKIRAENALFGTKQKILRVKNPLLDSNKGAWVFNSDLDETFEMSVSPGLDAYLKSLKRTILDASVKAYSIENDNIKDSASITIEEFQSSTTKPLLPYIFFDNNSAEIPSRYVKLNKQQIQKFSPDSLFNLGTLETYDNILNIIGWRMRTYPGIILKMAGCNSDYGDEKDNTELSRKRVEALKRYLTENWGVDTTRIKIEWRNLPVSPSNGLTEEGMAENRRAELYSTDDRLLAPLTTTGISRVATPNVINFKSFVSVKGGEATWRLNATQDGNVLKSFSGEGSLNEDLAWNINNEKQTMPKTESPVLIELLVKDKTKEKIVVAKGELPVKQITTKVKSTVYSNDKRLDKFSLILFDFGKSSLNENNVRNIKAIKDTIKPTSKIIITGYSDRIGNETFNQKLSEKRADEAAKALGPGNIETHGAGKGQLLYDNDLPEGRFYCRTVEILVETPLGSHL